MKTKPHKPPINLANLERLYRMEREEGELLFDMAQLVERVACLDDAGLPVAHKSAIRLARNLARRMQ